ncbi:MAG: Fur family transcriptional regulator [Acidimicrobiales bacterium]
MRSPSELTDSFRDRGLRITPQRVAVFEALHDSAGHPTAESIYQSVVVEQPSISLKTVYQTLNDLAEMGEIRRLDLGSTATRFDPNLDDHHHLVCDDCGVMIDTYLDVSNLELGELGGFQPSSASVFVSGRCASCAATPATA